MNFRDHGYAAIRWYKAHGDNSFLQVARTQWDLAYRATISPGTTSPNGVTAGKGFPVPKNCQDFYGNISFEGATFRPYSPNPNSTYFQTATLSLEFVLREAHKDEQTLGLPAPIGKAQLEGQGCDRISLLKGDSVTARVGATLETMSILHSISGSEDLGAKLQQTIVTTLDSLGNGSLYLGFSPGGVLFNRNSTSMLGPLVITDDGDMYLLRGLAEAYRRGQEILPVDLRNNMKLVLAVHHSLVQPVSCSYCWSNGGVRRICITSNISRPLDHTPSAPQTSDSPPSDAPASAIEPFVATTSQRRAVSDKHPASEIQPRVVVPEARVEPLRRQNSALTGAAYFPNDRLGIVGHSIIRSHSANITRHSDHDQPEARDMEVDPAFPDMVRALYERLWQPGQSETPPDYRSDTGEHH
ncbi:hypothetical protein PM082_014444 [Marasmius tenuissimus]|nr:hypothetical protein PM082_014444 [Marasmius tenuissimus]